MSNASARPAVQAAEAGEALAHANRITDRGRPRASRPQCRHAQQPRCSGVQPGHHVPARRLDDLVVPPKRATAFWRRHNGALSQNVTSLQRPAVTEAATQLGTARARRRVECTFPAQRHCRPCDGAQGSNRCNRICPDKALRGTGGIPPSRLVGGITAGHRVCPVATRELPRELRQRSAR
jgi:hypothetical protein